MWVSTASAWEIAIKTALGKVRPPGPLAEAVETSGFRQLPVTFRHAAEAGTLPVHHRDPLDRMLVAQARLEGLTLVTHDEVFDRYSLTLKEQPRAALPRTTDYTRELSAEPKVVPISR